MRYISFLFAVTLFASCKGKTSGPTVEELMDSVYTISGNIPDVDSGAIVVMQYLGIDKKNDTAQIVGTKFEFKGAAVESLVAELYIPQESHEPIRGVKILVENSVINIEGGKDSLYKADVIGGIGNKDFNTLKKSLSVYEDSIETIGIAAAGAQIENDTVTMTSLLEKYRRFEKDQATTIKQFALEHPKNIAGAYYVTTQYNFTQVELDSIYNNYDSTIKNTHYVKQIKEDLEAFKRTAIGQIAPDFTLNNTTGKPVALSAFKNKYVLLDFWASWCEPCRAENPNTVKAYQQFKGNNFEIVGISLDEQKQDWLQAIKKDKLTWPQLSDLKASKGEVAKLYGVRTIPANFLLDKNGVIIASNLHGNQLQKKLAELIKK